MKYCSNCGKEVADAAVVCPNCGCSVKGPAVVDDVPSTGLNVLAFFIPLVGLILYIINNDKAPNKAKAIGKWALIGFIVGVVLYGVSYGITLASLL